MADHTDDHVWHRIDRELKRRGLVHQRPSTWADLGREIGAAAQRMTNWTKRGVPAKLHRPIADALGWSVDKLLGAEEVPSGTSYAPAAAVRAIATLANPGTGGAMTVSEAIDVLARSVLNADDATRDTAAAALAGVMKRPDQAERFKEVLRALLPEATPEAPVAPDASAPHDAMLGGDSQLGGLQDPSTKKNRKGNDR